MNQTHDSIREQISALADGNLEHEAASNVLGAISTDEQLMSTWRTYHLIGDVLRSGSHAPCSGTPAFMARFQEKLAAEKPLYASVPGPTPHVPPPVTPQRIAAREIKVVAAEAANEPVFRWKLVAGAASLAAAAAIGWNLVGIGASPSGMQLAQGGAIAPVVVASQASASQADSNRVDVAPVLVVNNEPQIMLRDSRLDVLLEAHRQTGGASQMPSGFLRNATFDGPSR